MSSPDPTAPAMPVPNLHRPIPQYLARRFWQIAATLQSEALAPFGLVPWHGALLAQISETPGMDRNWLAAAIGIKSLMRTPRDPHKQQQISKASQGARRPKQWTKPPPT